MLGLADAGAESIIYGFLLLLLLFIALLKTPATVFTLGVVFILYIFKILKQTSANKKLFQKGG